MLPLSSCIVLWSSRRMVSSERSLESSEPTWLWSSRTVSSSLAIVSLFCWLSSKAFCKETWEDKQNLFFSFRIWKFESYLTLIKFELFRDVISTFCEAERGKKLYSWFLDAFFTWICWIFALRGLLYTGLAHVLCRIYVQMCFKSQHLRLRNRRLPFRPIK